MNIKDVLHGIAYGGSSYEAALNDWDHELKRRTAKDDAAIGWSDRAFNRIYIARAELSKMLYEVSRVTTAEARERCEARLSDSEYRVTQLLGEEAMERLVKGVEP